MPTSPQSAPPLADPTGQDQNPRRIREMFTQITPAYDRLNHWFSGWIDHYWRRKAARAATEGLLPCRRLLDVATGTGDLAQALGRAAGPSTAIFGADFTHAMLARAGLKYGHTAYRWIEADGLRLPCPDGVFDACTIAFGLRNMIDREAGLREMTRILRPGGRLVILEFSQPPHPLIRRFYDFYAFTVMPRIGAWISRSNSYLYLSQSIRRFWTPGQLAEAMHTAGMASVRATPMTFGIVYLHVGIKRGSGNESQPFPLGPMDSITG